MSDLFKTHLLNENGITKAREVGESFDGLLSKLTALCPEGRELALVKTKLEEACFFAKKAIARLPANQVIALVLFLLPFAAFAQTVDVPTTPSLLEKFLNPEGVGGLIALVLTAIGGFQFFTAKRKKLVALASYYAFHIVEDIGNEIEGEDGFDKTAKYLQKVDEYMKANGYRPLKPGEVEVAKLGAQALHGAEVAKAKIAEVAAITMANAAKLPGNPPTP